MALDNLGKHSIPKLFITYAIPSVFAMIIMSIYIVIDGIFVGQVVGSNALAAVNIAMPIFSITLALSVMLSTGTFTVVGIQLGENRKRHANNSFRLGFYGLLIINVILSIIIITFSESIARYLGATDVLLKQVKGYMVILAFFACGFGLSGFLAHGIRTIGYPTYSMLCNIIGAVLNIILDYVFIVKLNFGVEGAALASGISFSIAAIFGCIPFFKKNSPLKFGKCTFDLKTLTRFMYNGASEALAEAGFAFTTFLFNIVIIKQIGESGVTAFSIISYVSSIVVAIYLGISTGIGAIFSYNYGAKRLHRILHLLKLSFCCIAILGIICTILITLFGKYLILLFISDSADTLSLTVDAAKLYSLSFLVSGINILFSGFFTSIERPKESVIISFSRGVLFVSIFVLVLPLIIGTNGIWLSLIFAEVSTLIIGLILVKKTIANLKASL